MHFRNFLALFFLLAFSAQVLAVVESSQMKIFAVTTEGKGLSADLKLSIQPGSGRVWSSVAPLVGTTTQNAEIVAVELAKTYSSEVSDHDYLFEIKSEASVVEGPSAGSAMALLVVSALRDKKIPKEVGITGTIAEDGSVGPVGGIFEKSQEASRIGIKLFMIPEGEARQTVKLPSGVQNISLPDYALKEWGMKVVEVKNLDEALKLAFSNIEKIDVNTSPDSTRLVFVPLPIKQASSLQPLQKFTKGYLTETKALIESARNSLSTTLITDNSIINSLLSQLGDTEETVNEAQRLYDANYLYSAANYAFLARVNALTIKDIAENPSILSQDSTVLKVKIDSLKEKVQALDDEISKAIPVEGIEWYAASQQRLVWSRINLELISQPETVIIINGVQQGSDESVVKKIQDFEFAQGWYDIALAFYNFSRSSERFARPNDFFKKELDSYLVELENKIAVVQEEGNDDILRRVNSAKVQKEFEWYTGGVFDAVSALALIKGEGETEAKDYNSLELELDSKILAVDAELKDLNFQPVWANLYLDHARYYLNGARFYYSNAQESRAVEMLKSGVSLALLAESNLKAATQAIEHFSSIPETELVAGPGKAPFGVSVQVTPENNFLYYAIIILAIGLAGSLILLFIAVSKRSKGSGELRQFETLSERQKALAQAYAQGKITAEEFLGESRKLSEKISSVEFSAKAKSRQTVELDYLHSKISGLERSISVLKRDHSLGRILDSDYDSALKNIRQEISQLQKNASLTPSIKPKPKRESTALSEIARQVKKPSKPLKKSKKKKR